MTNPLLLFRTVTPRRRPARRRRTDVEIPTEVPSTDAVFLVLRRMRAPLIVLVVIFTICVAGLAAIPGVDADGNRVHMTVFEAFYFASYTATTIGFGEVPNAFTTAQRMWVTLSIYLLVVGWAYAIGSMLALIQEPGFREAVATQRFRSRVLRLREEFVIIAGYGAAGRQVVSELDADGRRVVVIDGDRVRVERLAGDSLSADIPGIDGDASNPAVLGLAGLDHPKLGMVLALTDNDETNLAIVMAANLLRPDVPVVARVQDRHTEERMQDFAPAAVINPNDRYGAYLVLSLQHPSTYQLVTWLMAPQGSPLKQDRSELASGRWVVCADGQFGQEVGHDLERSGLDVTMVVPTEGHPDLSDVAGFIAGTESDLTNIALAEHAKLVNPDTFVAVRQKSTSNAALLQALDVDSVFVPTDMVAQEALARIITPVFWSFVEHALTQDDAWAEALLERLRMRCGTVNPDREHITLSFHDAPAVARWLRAHELRIGDLLRDPDDRDVRLGIVPLALLRGDERVYAPDDDTLLKIDDELLLAGEPDDISALMASLFYDSNLEYVATGRMLPSSWIAQLVTGRRADSRQTS